MYFIIFLSSRQNIYRYTKSNSEKKRFFLSRSPISDRFFGFWIKRSLFFTITPVCNQKPNLIWIPSWLISSIQFFFIEIEASIDSCEFSVRLAQKTYRSSRITSAIVSIKLGNCQKIYKNVQSIRIFESIDSTWIQGSWDSFPGF